MLEKKLDEAIKLAERYGYLAAKDPARAEPVGQKALQARRELLEVIDQKFAEAYRNGVQDGSTARQ
jgi:hypothetical protein